MPNYMSWAPCLRELERQSRGDRTFGRYTISITPPEGREITKVFWDRASMLDWAHKYAAKEEALRRSRELQPASAP